MAEETIRHPDMVAKLVKAPADIISSLTEDRADLWHAATGIAGETAELLEALAVHPDTIDRDNVIEELGDLEFYGEQLRQRLGIDRDLVDVSNASASGTMLREYAIDAAIAGGRVLDLVKKAAVYDQPLRDDDLRAALVELDAALMSIMQVLSISRQDALDANIAKLGQRYKDHLYSDEQAAERKDKKGKKAKPEAEANG